jgi:hypothetical protein
MVTNGEEQSSKFRKIRTEFNELLEERKREQKMTKRTSNERKKENKTELCK